MSERSKVWFTSDVHIGHSGILYFHPARREVSDITLDELQSDRKEATKKHSEWLINLWNTTIDKKDTVYFLGDFCWYNKEDAEKVLQRLNGKKFLIRGNHDKPLNGLERYFEWVGDIKEVKFTNNQFAFIDPNETFCVELCHYPMLTWNRRPHGTCMVHGHTHGSVDRLNKKSKELRVDVGLDGELGNYKFVELWDLYYHFKNIVWKNTRIHNFFVTIGNKIWGYKRFNYVFTFQEYAEWLMKKQGIRM